MVCAVEECSVPFKGGKESSESLGCMTNGGSIIFLSYWKSKHCILSYECNYVFIIVVEKHFRKFLMLLNIRFQMWYLSINQ